MIQFAPGKTQSLHRHPGEAWLYVVEGYGHSFMGTAPDKGEHHRWKKGDLIVVDHFLWHQHFNDDPKNQCAPGARAHVRLDPRDDARADGSDGAVRGSRGHARSRCRRCRRSSGRTTSGPESEWIQTMPALRAPAGRALACTSCPPSITTRTGTRSSSRAQVKERLLAQALLMLQHGRKLSHARRACRTASSCSPARRAPARPRWRAAWRRWRRSALAREGATTLLEINPHAFPSDMLGESQRNIMRLLQDTIPEIAARRPHTVVLIDEVESFAVRRTSASFETNPVDVHRATDAVMLGIDEIAKKLPSVLFVTTTNFIDAIDDAFLSRADLVMHFALPNVETIANILQHSLASWRCSGRRCGRCTSRRGEIDELAALCDGWNGRQVRKLVLAGLAQRLEVAKDPALLTLDDLLEAARKRGGVEWAGDAAPPRERCRRRRAGRAEARPRPRPWRGP